MPNRHKNDFMPFQFYAAFFRGTLPGIKSGPLLYLEVYLISSYCTCVNSVKLPVRAISRFISKDRKIGRTVSISSFEICYFELLDIEILSAARSIPRPLKILHSSAKNYARTALLRVYFEMFYFKLLDPETVSYTHLTLPTICSV